MGGDVIWRCDSEGEVLEDVGIGDHFGNPFTELLAVGWPAEAGKGVDECYSEIIVGSFGRPEGAGIEGCKF